MNLNKDKSNHPSSKKLVISIWISIFLVVIGFIYWGAFKKQSHVHIRWQTTKSDEELTEVISKIILSGHLKDLSQNNKNDQGAAIFVGLVSNEPYWINLGSAFVKQILAHNTFFNYHQADVFLPEVGQSLIDNKLIDTLYSFSLSAHPDQWVTQIENLKSESKLAKNNHIILTTFSDALAISEDSRAYAYSERFKKAVNVQVQFATMLEGREQEGSLAIPCDTGGRLGPVGDLGCEIVHYSRMNYFKKLNTQEKGFALIEIKPDHFLVLVR